MNAGFIIRKTVIPKLRKELKRVHPESKTFRVAYDKKTSEIGTDVELENGERIDIEMKFDEKQIKEVLSIIVKKGTHYALALISFELSGEGDMILYLYKKDGTMHEPITI